MEKKPGFISKPMLKNCLSLIKANALTYVGSKYDLTQPYHVIIGLSYFFSNQLLIEREFVRKIEIMAPSLYRH